MWDYLILISEPRYNDCESRWYVKPKQEACRWPLQVISAKILGTRTQRVSLASDDFRPIFPQLNVIITLGIVSGFWGVS